MSFSKTKKDILVIDLMSSAIWYDKTITEQFKIPFEEARTSNIARDMESTNVLDTNITSKN